MKVKAIFFNTETLDVLPFQYIGSYSDIAAVTPHGCSSLVCDVTPDRARVSVDGDGGYVVSSVEPKKPESTLMTDYVLSEDSSHWIRVKTPEAEISAVRAVRGELLSRSDVLLLRKLEQLAVGESTDLRMEIAALASARRALRDAPASMAPAASVEAAGSVISVIEGRM